MHGAPGARRDTGRAVEWACGDGGDQPTEQPKHDFTCTDESELILFTPNFGERTESGTGVEAVLNSKGRVIKLRESRGSQIPRDGSVLSGTGEAAEWLRAHARPGAKITISTSITADGAPLAEGTSVVNGGPRLLSNGEPDITAYQEGFVWPENPEFYYRFGVRRNPRTLAGTTAEGNLLSSRWTADSPTTASGQVSRRARSSCRRCAP